MGFDCTKCPGYCCSHELIEVSEFDIARLAKHLGLSKSQTKKRYTYRYKTRDTDQQSLRHHKDDQYGSICRFFDREKRQCTVYDARPNVCRKYPYGNSCGYYSFLRFERAHQDDQDYVPLVRR